MSTPTYESLKSRYEAAGQAHVFTFWDTLSPSKQQELLGQLDALNIERVNRVYERAIEAEKAFNNPTSSEDEKIEPLPADAFDTIIDEAGKGKENEWRGIGLDAIKRGEVAVLLMAGGQGTRLGSSAPKGCYDIGLPSSKSLFQYQAERIKRLQEISSGAIIPWYVMTSGPTRKDTEDFFKKNTFFGLDSKNIIFFEQGTLPCLTMDGKVILDAPSKIAVAPDGNGGVYAALRSPLSVGSSSTVITDLEARKITYIHAYCVDNCLVRVADPTFIGYCISKQADCAAKVVRKTQPTESVGVVALKGGKYSVVEYSEISAEDAARKVEGGEELAFRAANIANHFYTTEFLKGVQSFEDKMAFHIARKKIPHIDLTSGEAVKPSKPNGLKLELFVFDVFPFTERFAVLEVDRKEEFSPLKNAPGTGVDDPQTSRRDLLQQQKRFLEAAGVELAADAEVEVGPLVSYAGEGLQSLKGKKIAKSGVANSIKELEALV